MRRLQGAPPTREQPLDHWVLFDYLPACDGCRMCAQFCPTGALVKIGPDARSGIGFVSSRCTDCRLCVDLCYRKAVTLSPERDLLKIIANKPESFPMPFARHLPGL